MLVPHDFLLFQEEIGALGRLRLPVGFLHLLDQPLPVADSVALDPFSIVAIIPQSEHQFVVVINCELLPFLFVDAQDIHGQGGFLDLLAEVVRLELFFPILSEQGALCSELLHPQGYLFLISQLYFRVEQFLNDLIDMVILTLLAIQLLLDIDQLHLIRHVHDLLLLLQPLSRHGTVLELHLPPFEEDLLPAFEERCDSGQQLHYNNI